MNKEIDVAAKTAWGFDVSHSEIVFKATHLVITDVRGQFRSFDGTINTESDDFNDAEVEFSADVASIDTNNKDRDNHLRSDDFFNVEKYPQLNFKGYLVKNEENYVLKGDLKIRDITKPVSLAVEYRGTVKDPFTGVEKAGFKINGRINRFDYKLKWNVLMEAGGAIVGPEIRLECNVELQKQG